MNINSKKIVLTILSISFAILFVQDFLYFKKTRLRVTAHLSAFDGLGIPAIFLAGLIIIMIILVMLEWKYSNHFLVLLSGMNIVLLIYIMSVALQWLPFDKTDYSRLSFGPISWLWIICMFSVLIKASENMKKTKILFLLQILPVIILFICLITHQLDGLSVMKEYANVKNIYWDNFYSHIWIAGIVMLLSIVIGVPLGYFVNKNVHVDKIVFTIINIVETIPGISFIALLMIPFTYISVRYPALRDWGIKAFGPGPAIIALTFYAIFPIIHNTRAAFKGIDDLYLEVAQAMGMNRKKIFFKVLVPMAFPTILNGIRIALVYTISGVTLAAFIGGGGLGSYMLRTESMDTVLLGLVPVIIMTFVADKGLGYITEKILHGGMIVND